GAKADLRGWEWRYLWQQCRGDAPFALFQGQVEIESLAVSPDSHYLAVGEREFGGLSVWDLRARRELARPPAGEYGAYVAVSSGRRHVWDPSGRFAGPECRGGEPQPGLLCL